jgi:hypothetical protein
MDSSFSFQSLCRERGTYDYVWVSYPLVEVSAVASWSDLRCGPSERFLGGLTGGLARPGSQDGGEAKGCRQLQALPRRLSVPPTKCCKSRQVAGEGPISIFHLCSLSCRSCRLSRTTRDLQARKLASSFAFVKLAVDNAMEPARQRVNGYLRRSSGCGTSY